MTDDPLSEGTRGSLYKPSATPVPEQSSALRRVINPLYRWFDWLYGSEFNPLYRSGTLAVGLLFVLLVTGLYLCFFYSVSQPYESLQKINEQVWLGRWIRTLHRYATVATVFAILFHILQLLVQGKTWGPRTLAWISGILLTGMYLLSAWSGYVMVWDQHGQRVAMKGAELLAVVPFLHDIVKAAFDGTSEIPPGFFFMNLFLHVALPLAMIMFLFVHTARLSRAVWFPKRSILVASVLGLAVLSVVWPAPLLPKASLLTIVGRIPTDSSTGFWISWIRVLGAPAVWAVLAFATALLCLIPWWWRPKEKDTRPISEVDNLACTGCMQCTRDCPYEAIKMVPRSDGKRLVAEIIPAHCVSCGICAASCADFAIGPPGRSAIDQRERVEQFCASLENSTHSVSEVLIACENNPGLSTVLTAYQRDHPEAVTYPVECCGCIHSEVLERILKVVKGCALVGCPARNCFNRDGGELLTERIYEKRVPFLDRTIDRSRILIAPFSECEQYELRYALDQFHARLHNRNVNSGAPSRFWRGVRSTGFSTLLLGLVAFAAQIPDGIDPRFAIIRVAGRLPSSLSEDCRAPRPEDIAGMPLHMQPKEICEREAVQYEVRIYTDGALIKSEQLGKKGGRIDQPLFLEIDGEVNPGDRSIEVSITRNNKEYARCERTRALSAGQIFLAHFKRETQTLECPEGAVHTNQSRSRESSIG